MKFKGFLFCRGVGVGIGLVRNYRSQPRSCWQFNFRELAIVVVESLKLCPTLCDTVDSSPPGSSLHGISQARILGWVAISFSKESSWCRDRTHISSIGRQILYCWATREVLQRPQFKAIWNVFRCATSRPSTEGVIYVPSLMLKLKWNSNTLATSCEELTHWKRPWCWEGLGAGEGDNREWDGWMASPTRWTWVWVNSGSWWWTGRPGVLRFTGSQRVGHDGATELTDSQDLALSLKSFQIQLSIYKCLKEQHLRTLDKMLNLRKTFSLDFVFSQLEPLKLTRIRRWKIFLGNQPSPISVAVILISESRSKSCHFRVIWARSN